MTNQWPADTLSREAFAAALQTIGVPETDIAALVPAGQSGLVFPDQAQLLEDFVKAAATPEQRQTLSKAAGCAYEELTKWVIRADLLRIKGMDAEIAKLLESAGVKGVHDLAACWEDEQRRIILEAGVKDHPQKTELEKFAASARMLDSLAVTEVSVILVVKGGGLQKPDETLDVFINGFWPAIKSIDPKATISKRQDIFPANYRSTAYDQEPLNHVTEIRSGERRIWLKEPNWEAAFVPPKALVSLFNEWRMATYAFGRSVHKTLFDPDTRERQRNFWQYYLAFALIYLMIFGHIGLTIFGWRLLRWIWTRGLSEPEAWQFFALSVAAAIFLAFIFAIRPALETNNQLVVYDQTKRMEALPGMASGVVALLMLAFLYSPWSYIFWLLLVVIVELALLRARAIAWPYRETSNSDSLTDYYYSLTSDEPDEKSGRRKIYKLTTGLHRRVFILLYRYIVVLTLPITFLGLTIARILKWTRVLGGIGVTLEQSLSLVLSGVLGDVVGYAMDPAQAHRVCNVIQTDLTFFHDQPEVSHIHVFAHSQGTPITFEVLFNHLPQSYRSKINTCVTIGSVLSYYSQANPVLDLSYIRRFPVQPYPAFADGFKWMNFWNLADPITEFYGLDEYNFFDKVPLFNLETNPPTLNAIRETFRDRNATKRHPASPTNIKTRATLQNHSEYWSNQDQVQIPLALRLLGVALPKQWNPEDLKNLPHSEQHWDYVFRLWLGHSAIFLLLFLLDAGFSAYLVDKSLPTLQGLVNLIPALLQVMLNSQSGLVRDLYTVLVWLAQAVTYRYSQELLAIAVMLASPAVVTLLLTVIAWPFISIGLLTSEIARRLRQRFRKQAISP